VDELFKHAFSIPIRVSPSIVQQKTVLIASLDKQDSLLRIEDAWLVGGEFLRSKSFSKRWEKAQSFYSFHFKSDPFLQQGLRIELASFTSLSQLSTLVSSINPPSCLFAQSESASRRLRIPLGIRPVASHTHASHTHASHTHATHTHATRNGVETPRNRGETLHPSAKPFTPSQSNCRILPESPPISEIACADSDPNHAKLIPHDVFPDTYYVLIDNVKKGYAAVQDLDLSVSLRKRVEQKLPLFAKVDWNSEFNMYEICNLLTEDK
jgi:hypothetical protein